MRRFRRVSNGSNYAGPLVVGTIYDEDFEPFTITGKHPTIAESVVRWPNRWEEVFDKPKLFKLL